MLLISKWEMFHTDSVNDVLATDQISIDVNNKRFILDLDAIGYGSDEYVEGDEDRVLQDSIYVSRLVFDVIVSGLRAKGFTELIAKK